jgi:predicted RNase H-like HicB family nuclease
VKGRIVESVSEPLQLTVLYEDDGEGWIVARIKEIPAAMSQGRTREEARDNVIDALRELILSYLDSGDDPPIPDGAVAEPLNVTLIS